jgi:hypothetical protein
MNRDIVVHHSVETKPRFQLNEKIMRVELISIKFSKKRYMIFSFVVTIFLNVITAFGLFLINNCPREVQRPIPNHPQSQLRHEIEMKSKIEKEASKEERNVEDTLFKLYHNCLHVLYPNRPTQHEIGRAFCL